MRGKNRRRIRSRRYDRGVQTANRRIPRRGIQARTHAEPRRNVQQANEIREISGIRQNARLLESRHGALLHFARQPRRLARPHNGCRPRQRPIVLPLHDYAGATFARGIPDRLAAQKRSPRTRAAQRTAERREKRLAGNLLSRKNPHSGLPQTLHSRKLRRHRKPRGENLGQTTTQSGSARESACHQIPTEKATSSWRKTTRQTNSS